MECVCWTSHPCPCKVAAASYSDSLFCPGGPEQRNNLDVPPKLFLMVIIKGLPVSFSQSYSDLHFFCGPITQVKRGALVLTSVVAPGSGPGQGNGRDLPGAVSDEQKKAKTEALGAL